MMKGINVSFSLGDDKYLSSVRLVAGSVCVNADMSIDDVEDFKLCVSECVLIMKRCGYEEVECTFCSEDRPRCEITGIGGVPVASESNKISFTIIDALIEKCEIVKKENDAIEKVILEM